MNFKARANSAGVGDAQLAPEMLLEFAQPVEDDPPAIGMPRVDFIEPEPKPAAPQSTADLAELVLRNPSLSARIDRVQEHAGGDCFPVRDAE